MQFIAPSFQEIINSYGYVFLLLIQMIMASHISTFELEWLLFVGDTVRCLHE
jgi:hypothetical protein